MLLLEQTVIYVLFAFALIANLIAEARDSETGKYYTKPLLIPLIMVFYLIMSRDTNAFIVMALSFSLLGDIFMMFERSNMAYRFGALSFLIGYLCWTAFILFSLDLTVISTNNFLWPIMPASLPVLICTAIIWKYLRNIKVLIAIYILAGIILLYFCLLRFGQVPDYKAILAIIGCVFFIISDFLVVLSRFKQDFKYSGVYIMFFYVTAVICFVVGFMEPIIK